MCINYTAIMNSFAYHNTTFLNAIFDGHSEKSQYNASIMKRELK